MAFTFLPCEVNVRDFEKVLEPSCPGKAQYCLERERERESEREGKHPINFGLMKLFKRPNSQMKQTPCSECLQMLIFFFLLLLHFPF